MKAVVYTAYGPPEVLQLAEVDKPAPGSHDVLVRIRATTVTAEDPKLRAFKHPPLLWLPIGMLFGFRRPRRTILGTEFAGEVEAVGKDVTRYREGDPVFGYTGTSFGAHAEYKCIPERAIMAAMPSKLSYEQAASIPNGALTALVYLRNMARLRPHENVLVYGASGAVGTAAVQLAKALGARVTGVCSGRNLALVESLGADEVIDYTRQDFTRNGQAYDIVFDTIGKTSMAEVEGSLRPRGRYLVTVFGIREILRMLWTSLVGGKRILGGASNFHWTPADLAYLRDLIEAGKLTAVIDRSYPLADAAQAHRYVEAGHKRGNVVLTVDGPPRAATSDPRPA
ncbi:NAD(P)-dependent alcohol dehydrogenase [Sorangium sp. So ce1153]|uniref:NAD(P)-dependent alcohol dehydrogenase n=1 Tax=Sorangium sp. So ce1153 TaxID=3133333 RepID=UPI003F634D49